jgi:hypothetical protein
MSATATLNDALNDSQRDYAWRACYRDSIDQLPDVEIRWERDRWASLGVPTLARICDDLLRERARCGLMIPGEATPAGLDALWRRVTQEEAIARVEERATSLVTTLRLGYWVGWRA